jgi:hypothetical protein
MLQVGAVTILFFSLSTLSNGLLQGIGRMKEPIKNAIIALENTSGGADLEKYKEGDLLRVVRNENTKYKKQHGVSALT